MANIIRGTLVAEPGDRYAVVVSRFNRAVTERLAEGAREALESHGVAPSAIDIAITGPEICPPLRA